MEMIAESKHQIKDKGPKNGIILLDIKMNRNHSADFFLSNTITLPSFRTNNSDDDDDNDLDSFVNTIFYKALSLSIIFLDPLNDPTR